MNARILVCIPAHNRAQIVRRCIPTVRAGMADEDVLNCYNDGSTEYGHTMLYECGAHSVAEFQPGVGIEVQRRLHFLAFAELAPKLGFTNLYLTDSDSPHDPTWREEALRLQAKYGQAPLCLYNTTAHSLMVGNTIEDEAESEVIWRRVAPGISYFLTAEHVAKVVDALPYLPQPHWNWDWATPALLGGRFAVSRLSYCDHIGVGGYHHPASEGYNGGDRALSSTPWLVNKRADIVRELEAL